MSIVAPLRRQLLPRLTPALKSRKSLLTRFCSIKSTQPTTTRTSFHTSAKMSFSNADTGSKTADPYVEKNLQHPELKEKVDDLVAFVDGQKFCMMTTRIGSSGLLVSRCMALAAKASLSAIPCLHQVRTSHATNPLTISSTGGQRR